MKNNDEINEFTRKVVKDLGVEKPSDNFVFAVMNSVNELQEASTVTQYKPLISNKTWGVIGVFVTAICTYFVLNNSEEINSKYSVLFEDYANKAHNFYNPLTSVNYSSIFVVCFTIFMIFAFIQLFSILKYYQKSTLNNGVTEY